MVKGFDSSIQVTCHLQPPSNMCSIKHTQLPQLALVLQGGNLTAQVLQSRQKHTQGELKTLQRK
jgi:hypothetical protein